LILVGVVPLAVAESQFPVEFGTVEKFVGDGGPVTDSVCTTGVVLPAVALKAKLPGVTLNEAGVTTKDAVSVGLLEAPCELIAKVQLYAVFATNPPVFTEAVMVVLGVVPLVALRTSHAQFAAGTIEKLAPLGGLVLVIVIVCEFGAAAPAV
jgi:hypothetical protein